MDGIGWAASAMSAARSRLDVAAENLANGSTDGFRKTALRGFLTRSGVTLQPMRSGEQGALRRTGRPFDLAIAGNGRFQLRTVAGRVVTSRNGAFVRDRFNRLTDEVGSVLLGQRGPLRVPDGASIEPDGRVTKDGKTLDRIPLSHGASLHAGFLEASNVDAIGEMVDLMTAQRSFETAEKVLSAIDQTRERAATQVGALK